jgi:2-polyprenyl-6-methoxyphenol hydroxylase-like FAD-dependent oxidoreductase
VPVGPWQTQRITLLGDAIHSMTPFRGIGANVALRDAANLCEALCAANGGEKDLLESIHSYEAQMLRYGFRAVRGDGTNSGRSGHRPLPQSHHVQNASGPAAAG